MAIEEFQDKYRWLSNFWPCELRYEGIEYPSAEHAFQAAKTTNPLARQSVANCSTAYKAKRAGKHLILRPNWDEIKLATMEEVVMAKFLCNDHLRDRLLATGEQQLIEGNLWKDTYWGVCNGFGENHLGIILMTVRDFFSA